MFHGVLGMGGANKSRGELKVRETIENTGREAGGNTVSRTKNFGSGQKFWGEPGLRDVGWGGWGRDGGVIFEGGEGDKVIEHQNPKQGRRGRITFRKKRQGRLQKKTPHQRKTGQKKLEEKNVED